MLPDMSRHNLPMLRDRIIENPLDKIVAILVARDINKWNSSAILAALANTIKITTKKVVSTNLETFLNDFGGELISAIFGCVPDDVVDGSASVGRSTMLADMLNAPVSKLTVSNDVNVGKDFFDARSLSKKK